MAAEIPRGIKLCGTDESDPPSRLLRAGPLSVELESGNLRYVRFAGIEVLRSIAFLVRDENWGTFTPTITDLEVEEGDGAFRASYRGTCADAKRRLVYTAAATDLLPSRLSPRRRPASRPTAPVSSCCTPWPASRGGRCASSTPTGARRPTGSPS